VFEMAGVPREQDECARLGDRSDRDVGEARRMPFRRRAVREGAGDRRGFEVERQDAVAVEKFNCIPPGFELLGFAFCPFARRFRDADANFGGRDDRQKSGQRSIRVRQRRQPARKLVRYPGVDWSKPPLVPQPIHNRVRARVFDPRLIITGDR